MSRITSLVLLVSITGNLFGQDVANQKPDYSRFLGLWETHTKIGNGNTFYAVVEIRQNDDGKLAFYWNHSPHTDQSRSNSLVQGYDKIQAQNRALWTTFLNLAIARSAEPFSSGIQINGFQGGKVLLPVYSNNYLVGSVKTQGWSSLDVKPWEKRNGRLMPEKMKKGGPFFSSWKKLMPIVKSVRPPTVQADGEFGLVTKTISIDGRNLPFGDREPPYSIKFESDEIAAKVVESQFYRDQIKVEVTYKRNIKPGAKYFSIRGVKSPLPLVIQSTKGSVAWIGSNNNVVSTARVGQTVSIQANFADDVDLPNKITCQLYDHRTGKSLNSVTLVRQPATNQYKSEKPLEVVNATDPLVRASNAAPLLVIPGTIVRCEFSNQSGLSHLGPAFLTTFDAVQHLSLQFIDAQTQKPRTMFGTGENFKLRLKLNRTPATSEVDKIDVDLVYRKQYNDPATETKKITLTETDRRSAVFESGILSKGVTFDFVELGRLEARSKNLSTYATFHAPELSITEVDGTPVPRGDAGALTAVVVTGRTVNVKFHTSNIPQPYTLSLVWKPNAGSNSITHEIPTTHAQNNQSTSMVVPAAGKYSLVLQANYNEDLSEKSITSRPAEIEVVAESNLPRIDKCPTIVIAKRPFKVEASWTRQDHATHVELRDSTGNVIQKQNLDARADSIAGSATFSNVNAGHYKVVVLTNKNLESAPKDVSVYSISATPIQQQNVAQKQNDGSIIRSKNQLKFTVNPPLKNGHELAIVKSNNLPQPMTTGPSILIQPGGKRIHGESIKATKNTDNSYGVTDTVQTNPGNERAFYVRYIWGVSEKGTVYRSGQQWISIPKVSDEFSQADAIEDIRQRMLGSSENLLANFKNRNAENAELQHQEVAFNEETERAAIEYATLVDQIQNSIASPKLPESAEAPPLPIRTDSEAFANAIMDWLNDNPESFEFLEARKLEATLPGMDDPHSLVWLGPKDTELDNENKWLKEGIPLDPTNGTEYFRQWEWYDQHYDNLFFDPSN